MPLLDHFHPPLLDSRHWEGFHARWAGAIADSLNDDLPDGYFADSQVHSGPRVEIDVAAFDARDGGGGTATAVRTLAPPDLTLALSLPPGFSVLVFEQSAGPRLVGAVELVSPGNKDREEARRAFAAKCLSYLATGVGLVLADVVTSRHSRPLDDLLALLEPGLPPPDFGDLVAAACRPLSAGGVGSVEVRARPLAVGQPLPALPLSLDRGLVVTVDLEATYQETRARRRL